MKKMTSLIAGLSIIATAAAQTTSTSIQYNKMTQPALAIELPNSTDDAEGTILQKLKEVGYNPETTGSLFWKNNKKYGFYVFNNVALPALGTRKIDMYFKVVPKNKEEINNSTVYLLVSTGNENFVSADSDPTLWSNADSFLQGFSANTTAYSLEQEIKRHETVLKDSRKKLTSLQDDRKGMEDKMKSLQSDIIKNQNDQAEQQSNLEQQEKSLDILRLKRKV